MYDLSELAFDDLSQDSSTDFTEQELESLPDELASLLDKYPDTVADLYLRLNTGYFTGVSYYVDQEVMVEHFGVDRAACYTSVFLGPCGCFYGTVGISAHNHGDVNAPAELYNLDDFVTWIEPFVGQIRHTTNRALSPLERFIRWTTPGTMPENSPTLRYLSNLVEAYAADHDIALPTEADIAEIRALVECEVTNA